MHQCFVDHGSEPANEIHWLPWWEGVVSCCGGCGGKIANWNSKFAIEPASDAHQRRALHFINTAPRLFPITPIRITPFAPHFGSFAPFTSNSLKPLERPKAVVRWTKVRTVREGRSNREVVLVNVEEVVEEARRKEVKVKGEDRVPRQVLLGVFSVRAGCSLYHSW